MVSLKSFIEFLNEGELINPDSKHVQPFASYDKAKALAIEAHPEFLRKLESVSGKVIPDIKSKDSFLDKVYNRGTHPHHVYDILRAAVIVDSKDDFAKVIAELNTLFELRKIDYKTKPEGPFGYYGAVHVDVIVDDLICEIQIMPKKLWDYKQETDKIYAEYRSEDKIPKSEMERCRALFKEANS